MMAMIRYIVFLICLLCIVEVAVSGENIPIGKSRQILLNKDWQYLEDPIQDVQLLPASKVAWKTVALPHTWNAFDAVDPIPGYRRNASWYEKKIDIPADMQDARVLLSFEGVNTQCRVYVNEQLAGGHIGGYLGFEIDITRHIVKGATNAIRVWADNSINPDIIPSQKSDFFIYGGICRNVWLKVLPPMHIQRLHIQTPSVTKSKAATIVQVTAVNSKEKQTDIQIEARVSDGKGKEVLKSKLTKTIASSSQTIPIEFPSLSNPKLWSPSNPQLYKLTVTIKESGKIIDTLSEKFGYRWFEFKEKGAFYLNGERLLLRGTQRHEESAGLGNALTDSMQRNDIRLVKEMGANFLRLAHYPQAPEVYRACDELGILVWDELPWCRGGVGGEQWKENTRNLLHEMIEQNYNHPSIIMWSLGNEIYMEPDFPGADNNDSLRAFLTQLNTIAHSLDPYRVTTIRKYYEGADIPDVFSPSIWSGWYSGAYFDYEKSITEARNKYSRLFHAEYGGDSHVGRHTENPVTGEGMSIPEGKAGTGEQKKIKNISLSGDWSESYIVNLFDWHLHVSEKLDWFSGNAQWIFKDFGTPLRPENPIPYINQKGLLDRAGKPKDAYYVYKSYWTTDPKFCYIESHTWLERTGAKDTKRTVKVFSNCEEVELIVNGVSESKKSRDITKFPACGLSWEILFHEGENKILAVGYAKGKEASRDSVTLNYTYEKSGETAEIMLSAEKIENGNYLITALAFDKEGRRNLTYAKRIYFTMEGDGRLLENYGTPTRSSIIEMANGKAQIEYEPQKNGAAIIEARNQDFKGAYICIEPK